MNESQIVLVPGTFGRLAKTACTVLESRGMRAEYLGSIDEDDITCGYAYIDNDVCVSTVATVGQYIRFLRRKGSSGIAVLAPELCRDCRSVSLPFVLDVALARAGFDGIDVIPFTDADLHACLAGDEPKTSQRVLAGPDMRIGLCGPLPVVMTHEFHRTVTERIDSAGFQVVPVPPERIAGQRDAFTPAVEFFAEAGIRTAICILPFGCMSGHAYARGQLRTLQQRFPQVEITMLDYDPSASDINLVNRTELVMQTVRDRT